MDRRLPTEFKRAWSATVVSVAVWLPAMPSWAAGDPEASSIPLPGAGSGAVVSGGGWVSLAVLAVGAGVAAWLWSRRRNRIVRGAAGGIQVIDRTSMGGGRSLALVRVGDRVVLVGESGQGFQRLAEFAADETASSADASRRLAS